MDNVKKGYETRIQQDLLTDAILGKNRIKLYQQHFQVSHELIWAYCDIIDRSVNDGTHIVLYFGRCNVGRAVAKKIMADHVAMPMVISGVYDA